MSIKPKYLGISEQDMVNGEHVHTITVSSGYYQTRSGLLWRGMKQRLKREGCYEPVENCFKDFPEFAKTVTSMENYYKVDINGNHYHMDKDLKCYLKDKKYAPDTITFIPSHLNTSLKGVVAFLEKKIPCGYSFNMSRGKFRAYCNNGKSKQIHLGYYATAQEAQAAWVKQKIIQIELSLQQEPLSVEILSLVEVILKDLKEI